MKRFKQFFAVEMNRYTFSEYERNNNNLTNRLYLMLIFAGMSMCLLSISNLFFLGVVLSIANIQFCLRSKKELIITYMDHAEKEWVTMEAKKIFPWSDYLSPKKITNKEHVVDVILGETICFWTEKNDHIQFNELHRDQVEITFERLPEGSPYIEYQAEQYVEFGFFDLLETTKELTEVEKNRWPQRHRVIIHTEAVHFLPNSGMEQPYEPIKTEVSNEQEDQ